MKAPKVFKKLWEGRQPLGHLKNGLPSLYVVVREDGAAWLMQDKSTGESTGAQVCLAIIGADVMAQVREPRKTIPKLVGEWISDAPPKPQPRRRQARSRRPRFSKDSGDA